MVLLRDILTDVPLVRLSGTADVPVEEITADSRQVKPGTLFFAIRGLHADGHQFISQAVESGAVAVVCEDMPLQPSPHITYVQVSDSALACGLMASHFYGDPSKHMQVVGVTGTNGKTTVVTLLYQLFSRLGFRAGLISTVQNMIVDKTEPATHTTPDAILLHRLLARMHQQGCTHVFMEASSHAIHQKRIAGVHYTGGIFTNITHDHLDYHKTFENYLKAKKSFFDQLPASAFALTNIDDRNGKVMVQNTRAKIVTYALRKKADFKARIIENHLTGLQLEIDQQLVHTRLIGAFNAYNLLAAYAAARLLGQEKQEVLRILSDLKGAEGRFDYLISPNQHIIAIVDYAHTPDALKNVLQTILGFKQSSQRIITVIGCGGDRDRSKRPEMALIATHFSDQVIFTSDNPRSEDPQAIIEEMKNGLSASMLAKTLSIVDRKEAIRTACMLAQSNDIVLIAGKGHEKYQEIKGVKYPFDDKEVVKEMFALLGK
ncbi:UDP-N-acetylmuramoyl-L-alanyl-D-glutamate--2,6-diaminopimelate ligase [Thermoflavifilum thermophilum]|uniref:UDP-N-acetylmuramoyl-L-alanyl-D-glutamate--2,6-diaminopimelate ligase n=1 Tax=Thermoflavifilum thermophilum TaxID=1393122 RepID=A0A1I7N4H8_9BACT|nr:UDP-N-acetylmuramoyl-L-alanyl-D-glutamate--2,6-diaminopimelate ligase [Thermoflavifilum thermophilum]SFV29503.1 UDP-N-acetylmuramoylalanyl-D-glutamate--2,6-diaminopimelate ligase [Thermoflavifilum thermophilum]